MDQVVRMVLGGGSERWQRVFATLSQPICRESTGSDVVNQAHSKPGSSCPKGGHNGGEEREHGAHVGPGDVKKTGRSGAALLRM